MELRICVGCEHTFLKTEPSQGCPQCGRGHASAKTNVAAYISACKQWVLDRQVMTYFR